MEENSEIFLIGKTNGHMELSVFNQIFNIKNGKPPKINFKDEKNNGEFVKQLIRKSNAIIGCHDLSEGGLALALSELCINNKIGVK